MKNMKNKGFTKTELIIVIAVVVVLAATLIPTFVGLAKNKNMQEQTQQDLDKLAENIENQKTLSIEEIEAKIAEAIAGIKLPDGVKLEDVNKAISDAIAGIEIPEDGLTDAQVQEIIDNAIAGIVIPEPGLSAADVEKIIADALKNVNTGLTSAEVEAIVNAAIAGIKLPEAGLTAEEVQKIVADAIAGIEIPDAGLTAEQVEKIVADAIAGIKFPEPGLSAEDIEKMINDAIAGIKLPEGGLTAEEVKQIVADAIKDIDTGLTAEEVKQIIADALKDINTGLTAEEVKQIIADALKDLNTGLTAEEVQKIVADAIAGIEFPEAGLTAEEVQKIVADALKDVNTGLSAEEIEKMIADAIEKALAALETKTEVEDLKDLEEALNDPSISTIVLKDNVKLDESFVIDRDITLDLNGNSLSTVSGLVYPDALVLHVAKDCELTIKGGTIVNTKAAIDFDMDFIRVMSGASLVLDDVNIALNVVPEVFWNNTKDVWQMNTAEHHVFTIGSNASVVLNNCDITVLAPEVSNYPDYVRNMSIVGVYFARNASNSEFVMNGGSFTMLSTASDATAKTDTLYFAMSDRDIAKYANASNTLALNGDVEITVGGLDSTGKLNSTNYLFYFGPGYYKGNTYYSGLKTVTMSTGTTLNINGFAYSVNTAEAKVWDVEGICQDFGTKKAQKEFYNAEEIKYHFTCTDSVIGCTYEAELTLSELAKMTSTVKINGVTYHKCPTCGKGGLEFQG